MKAKEIRQRFLVFFEKRDHTILSSASLIPENDPSVLFNTAGMQPLVPYLLGEKHPGGTRLASSQKCVRTVDIDDIGDNTHATFFEMLGNWSLGDYFKSEAIEWSYTFLTSHDEGLGLDPKRLYITVFEGNTDAPRDTEAVEMWKAVGVPEHRIYFKGKEDNWWSAGENGPSGPDSEMFYDISETGLGDLTPEEFDAADERQDVVEIWNDVFMQFEQKDGKVVGELPKKNIDTGAGLERLAAVLQKKRSIFDTDLLLPLVTRAKEITTVEKSMRIIADHMRTSIFLIGDGVIPSNTDQGYILRRLLRRAIFNAESKTFSETDIADFVDLVIDMYGDVYSNLIDKREIIKQEINKENEKFARTLAQGVKEFEKLSSGNISGRDAFVLFSSYGFPFELTVELATEKGVTVDENGFRSELEKHQELSRTSSAGKFKGGLAGSGEMETKYHTATHLLNAALRDVLGDHIEQKGSNITAERLRFDFAHGEKMTDEEKQQVTEWVNDKIQKDLPVRFEEVTIEQAREMNAVGVFGDKYGETVKVYTVGTDDIASREICGGPHVEHTGVLGTFRIKKEEASSAGVRRIKAVLE